MNKLMLLSVVLLILGSLGTAKGLNDIKADQTEDLIERPSAQHDEFDSEEKMQEKTKVNGQNSEDKEFRRLRGLSNAKANLKGGTIAQTVIGGLIENTNKNDERRGFEVLRVEETSEESGTEHTVNLLIIHQLDDRKQVNTIDPETVDDIQAGKADEGRKEIAVISKRSSRKGRNPQTGKEIKIAAQDGDYEDRVKGLLTALAMEGKVKFFNEAKERANVRDDESGEEYFIHTTVSIDEIRDEDDVRPELREGRKGMNAVDVRRTD